MVQSGGGYWYPDANVGREFSDEAGYKYQYQGDPTAVDAMRAAGQQVFIQTAPGQFAISAGTPPPGTPLFTRLPGQPANKIPGTMIYDPASPGTTPAPGTSAADKSAKALIDQFLSEYGLGSLGSTAWQWYLTGQSPDQILLNLRETPEYQARFPAMKTLSKRGQAISERDYINFERSIATQNQAAGLTEDWNDPQDIQKLLESNVSPAEYQARLQARQTAVWQSPPEVRQALQDYYGISAGQLTAFWIDPDRALPLIQRDLAAAQAGGTAQRTGFGQLDRDYAEHLADLGLTQEQLDVGFNRVAGMDQITQGLPGQQPGIGTTTALQAQFDRNAQAQAQVEAAQADILNQFRRGGAPAATAKGVLGAGSTG